jgi:hypothetical protein
MQAPEPLLVLYAPVFRASANPIFNWGLALNDAWAKIEKKAGA